MDEEKWDEEFIKSSLKNLPNIQDDRSMEEVFQRLKADERWQEKKAANRKRFNWLPMMIGIAALFFVMLSVPFIQKNMLKSDQASPIFSREMHTVMDEEIMESELTNEDAAVTIGKESYLVLQETEEEQLFSVDMLFGEQIIPVTFILALGKSQDWSSLFEQYAGKIDVQGLGFDQYKDEVTTIGPASYFKLALPNGDFYLLPKENPNMDIEEALLNMKYHPDEAIESVIPQDVQYEVKVKAEVASLQFQQSLDLEQLSREEAMLFIEGVMLTAAQFNRQVQFENIKQLDFEQYDLTKPLPKPIGSNPIYDLYEN